MQPDTQISLAALLMPILALIVISAVDSVDEEDGAYYRAFVAGASLAAVGPIAIVVLLGVLSTVTTVTQGKVVTHSLLSILLIFVLIFGVVLQETQRGMEESDNTIYLLSLFLVAVWYLVLYLVL